MSPRLKKGRCGLSLRMHAGGQFEAYSSPLTGIAEPGTRREIRRSDSQDHPQWATRTVRCGHRVRGEIAVAMLQTLRVQRCRSCCMKDSVL
jgi:hypothetical protein